MRVATEVYFDRASGKGDYALIVDSFKRNVADEEGDGKKRWRYAEEQRALLDRLLVLPSTECRVLASKDSPTSVVGWIAWTPVGQNLVAVHYVYVKFNVRPMGCAEALFALTGAEGKRLCWTFGGRVAEKLSARLVEAGRIQSAGHVPAKDFLFDIGDDDGRSAST